MTVTCFSAALLQHDGEEAAMHADAASNKYRTCDSTPSTVLLPSSRRVRGMMGMTPMVTGWPTGATPKIRLSRSRATA
jgi:hypothetical protein